LYRHNHEQQFGSPLNTVQEVKEITISDNIVRSCNRDNIISFLIKIEKQLKRIRDKFMIKK